MSFRSAWFIAILALLAVAVPPTPLFGQVDQGTITGIVQDPSGAVIPNASITLTNVDLGLVLNAKTDNGGIYVFIPCE
jgi:hypothetical protein